MPLALAAPLAALQEGAHADHGAAAPAPPDTSHLRVEHDPERKELTIALGPIDLPANTTHHALRQLPVQRGTVPFDFTIRSYRVQIVDGDGRPVPQAVLHHMNVLDPERRELFLPIMLRVLAASHETPPVSVPGWLFGIPMRGGAPFLALTMLHNPTPDSFADVSVRLILGYERSEYLPMYTIVPFHLDTMFPLGTKGFDLPPGRFVKTYDASPAVPGLIVGLSGHLHQFATELKLENLTTGEILYRITPEVDEEGHIERIPVLRHRGKGLGAPVRPEHVYRVTAEYYNPTGAPIVGGGMGAVAGGFVPLDAWPASDPRDPLYVADYEWVFASLAQHGGEAEHRHDPGAGAGGASRD